jgi:mRNA-degrading endonuclease toxin of MazEF toxin-antitoxin module
VNLDTIATIPKQTLTRRLTALAPEKLAAVERALRFAVGLV